MLYMALSEKQELEIVEMFAVYAEAYHKKDKSVFSAICSPDIIGFGSGPDEEFTGRKRAYGGNCPGFQAGFIVAYQVSRYVDQR